ncbi:MAG: hypothetical protein KDA41_02015 [Planctomycetales bacterium]|nr:hypothetical protein [Planctomycetales bacterium]
MAVAGVSLLVFVIAFGAVIAVQAQDPDIDPNDSPVIMVSSVSLCCGIPLLNAVGLLLGIIAVFQPDRLKLFGVIGSIINGIVVFGGVAFVIFAMILGASMQ